MTKYSLQQSEAYDLMSYVNILDSVTHAKQFVLYRTLVFHKKRALLHQKIIDSLLSSAIGINPSQSSPQARIVIGGAGSGKSYVAQLLNKSGAYLYVDSDLLKEKLATHESEQNNELSKRAWLSCLQREAVFLRQELLHQAIKARRHLIFETVGSDSSAVQLTIDILRVYGYQVELHLADTSEKIALYRVSQRNADTDRFVSLVYAQKSNRKAKATYNELSIRNQQHLHAYRWFNDDEMAATVEETRAEATVHLSSQKLPELKKPIDLLCEEYREERSGNKYSDMLWESHIAKLIVHNPRPYEKTVLKVNQYILDSLPMLGESQKNRLIIILIKKFSDFKPEQNPLDYLTTKLKSNTPQDIYHSLLFHKPFFEQVQEKSYAEALRDRYAYYSMRPFSLYGKENRGAKREQLLLLPYHTGIGHVRLHQLGSLQLHQDSFNESYHEAPAVSAVLFIEANTRLSHFANVQTHTKTLNKQIIQYDALFGSGTSGTATTVFPYVFQTILKDDPLAQQDYILALSGATAYAGHHSLFELLVPLKYMKSLCPEQLMDIGANHEELYERILTQRFKYYIHRKEDGAQSLYELCMQQYAQDLATMNRSLATTKTSNSEPVAEKEKRALIKLIDNKLHLLERSEQVEKFISFFKIKRSLEQLSLSSASALNSLLNELKQQISVRKQPFFSLFFKTDGSCISESQWILETIRDFIVRHYEAINTPQINPKKHSSHSFK